jgi:hypothetical protein
VSPSTRTSAAPGAAVTSAIGEMFSSSRAIVVGKIGLSSMSVSTSGVVK